MGATKVVAKFQLNEINVRRFQTYDHAQEKMVEREQHYITAYPVISGDVNKAWADASPGGELKLTIDNPAAAKFFRPGMLLYVELTEAPEKDTPESLARVGLQG